MKMEKFNFYFDKYAYKWASAEGRDKLNLTSSSDIPSLDVSKTTDSLSFSVINNIREGTKWSNWSFYFKQMENMHVMNKNQDYWDKDTATLNEVNTKIVKEA